MKILRNLENCFAKYNLLNYFLYFFLTMLIIVPNYIGFNKFIKGNHFHFLNIFFSTLIFFYGILFKYKKYYYKIFLISFFFLLINVLSENFNLKSLFNFYYIFIICFSSLILIDNVSINKILNNYSNICFILAIYGIYEYLNPYEQFEITDQSEERANSIFREPSHFASLIIPSLAFYLKDFKKNKLEFFTILLASILTLSLTSYFLLMILFYLYIMIQIYKKNITIFKLIILITSAFLYIILNFDLSVITNRYFLSLKDFFILDSINYNRNLTLWSVVTSIKVNLFSLLNYPLGVGFGNFNLAYYEFIEKFAYKYNFFYGPDKDVYSSDILFWYSKTLGFNDHGHSIFFRVISEIGFLSFIFYGIVVYFLILTFQKDDENIPIYLAVLIFIIAKFLKISSYYIYGSQIFFVIFLYLSIRSIVDQKKIRSLFIYFSSFLLTYSLCFILLTKINNQKTYRINLYANEASAEFLLATQNLLRTKYTELKKTNHINIDFRKKKAILNLTYFSNEDLDPIEIKKYLNNEYEKFKNNYDNYSLRSISTIEEEYYKKELLFADINFFEKFDVSYFIKKNWDNKLFYSDEQLKIIKKKFRENGIYDINFIDNLNNEFPTGTPDRANIKRILTLKNLLNAQKLYINQSKQPSYKLSILINYYSNPKFKPGYSIFLKPELYRVEIFKKDYAVKLSHYIISLIASCFSIILLFVFINKRFKIFSQ